LSDALKTKTVERDGKQRGHRVRVGNKGKTRKRASGEGRRGKEEIKEKQKKKEGEK